MGHVRLGPLPQTRAWRAVVDILAKGGDVTEVADAASAAGNAGLEAAKRDPAVAGSLFLLAQLSAAARQDNFAAALNEIGVPVSQNPSLFDLTGAVGDAIDSSVRPASKTDLGEMAALAAVEALTTFISSRVPSLFEPEPSDIQAAVRSLSTDRNFATLTRTFFARLTERYLTYFLSRELSTHVGPDHRFHSIDAHSDFNAALRLHCYQAARIVEGFAGDWYSKASWQKDLSLSRTRRFTAFALKKLRSELSRRERPIGGVK